MSTRDGDFGDEIRAHIAIETDRLIAEGLSPDEAAAAARRTFGNVTRAQEAFFESRRPRWLEDAWRDVRYACRTLAKTPGFAALAILTLAVGIGVNAAVFVLIDAFAWRPLPVADAGGVFRIERWLASGARGDIQYAFSEDEYVRMRDESRTLTAVVAAAWPERLASGDETLALQRVSPNFFADLGVHAAAGRTFDGAS